MIKAGVPLSFPSPRLIITIGCLLIFSVMLQDCRRGNDPDELVMMVEKRISTLDPRVSSDSANERMRQLIFNGLTRKNEKFDPVPDLAERFESTPDFKTFTFYLKPGIKFHNNSPLSALDVKYTFETMLAPDFPSDKKAELAGKLSIEVKDPLTVVFHCKEPFPGFANAIIPVGIIPEGTSDQQAKRPIGTGPFKFAEFIEDQELRLTANQEYFAGAPSIARLRVKIVPDNSTRESELRKGSVDLAINADFDPITVESLRSAEGLKVDTINGTNVTHLGVNLEDPILKDRRVRQALAYAIDRDAIIRDVLHGQAHPAYSILPVSQWAYESGIEKYPYNPERAKQLLDEAGLPGQPRARLSLKTSTISVSRKIGETLQEQLRRVGVALEIQPLERAKLTEDMKNGNFQLYLNTSVGGNQSTDFFKFAYSTDAIKNGQNRSRYSNPLMDKLISEAQTASREQQKQIFSQIQKQLAIDLPQIYLWYPETVVVHNSRIGNIQLEPSGDWQVVRNVKVSAMNARNLQEK